MSNPGKVICQVCKTEIDGEREDGLPVAKDHFRPNGEHCLGSRIFALPVEKKAKVRNFAAAPERAGDIRLPAAEIHTHQSSIYSKLCSGIAIIFK